MGSTPPSAGVTPAPGEKKSRNGEDAISLRGFGGRGSDLASAMLLSPRSGSAQCSTTLVSRRPNIFKMVGDVLQQPPAALPSLSSGSVPPSRGKGGEGDRTWRNSYLKPLTHTWGRGQGLGLCSYKYLWDIKLACCMQSGGCNAQIAEVSREKAKILRNANEKDCAYRK